MDSIKRLQQLFSQFPTIGSRTAGRFVFYLIGQPKEKIDELVEALQNLQKNTKACPQCFNPYEDENALCPICSDTSRNRQILCIVEKEADLLSIENTKKYKGLYFILGGTLTMRKTDGSNLRIKELQDRVGKSALLEIIIALNPTPEGISTSGLVERALRELPQFPALRITHLAKGLPSGGELEYADEETLMNAFEGRK